MNVSGLLPLTKELAAYDDLRQALQDADGSRWLAGHVNSAAHAYLLAALQRDRVRPLLVVAPRPEAARKLFEAITRWTMTPEAVHHFPAPDASFYDKIAWDPETTRRRVRILAMLAAPGRFVSDAYPPLVVTSAAALMLKTAAPAHLNKGISQIKVGQRLDLNRFLEGLLRIGYQPATVVEESGYFSRRGGIIDVYAPSAEHPLRIELFGDEIDSLRTFDPHTQRSLDDVKEAQFCPATEAVPLYGRMAAKKIERMDLDRLLAMPRQRWQQDLEDLEFGQAFHGIEFYLPLLYASPASPLNFLPANAAIVTMDMDALDAAALELMEQAEATRAEMIDEGALPDRFPVPYFRWSELAQEIETLPRLDLSFLRHEGQGDVYALPGFQMADSYGGQLDELVEEYREQHGEQERVVMISHQAQRLAEIFRESEIIPEVRENLGEVPPPGSLTLVQGNLERGWGLYTPPEAEIPLLSVLTDNELFGWSKYRTRRRVRRRSVSPETFFADLDEGDYVVHMEHGIAIYRGMERKTVDNVEREYLELEYAAGDRLYVPVNQADQIARYVGTGQDPALHRLGTADWDRVKQRAKKAVQDIARDLLRLYAAREVIPGYSFSSDTTWQTELEASFPYEETRDQLEAIEAVKEDMESDTPMDRLVCGDVGYGKTEVALRAAFKAVMDGKQAAILVPTTVLAQQHYITFRDRLEAYPIEVEMLSRFRTRAEQKRILSRLASGRVDIIVGTHRLIQKDVEFKDLGLLIIDEEQRFGVVHKERLKQMRSQVDVLTLTATPIPRTLYMALTGARDMSIIDTPPEERMPIRTQVAEFSDSLIRKAILREKSRGGQVYFVHNRVQGIRQIAQHLRRIVPEASFVIGHGQMPEKVLSQVMLDFMAAKYDVLVCTTIIESGLDIPNVNTIVINRADNFGLAQLYQLRGRVGRSAEQAYAYLLYNKNKPLSDIARLRLETIMEASELGAGYRVAMRDLEIRGAGEILGARQHGQIAAVGFDLYTRLLAQAVNEMKEEEAAFEPEAALPFSALSAVPMPSVDLPLSAHLPTDYVQDDTLRLKLYQRLSRLTTPEEVESIGNELADRFGSLPDPAKNLLYLLELKALAREVDVSSISRDGQRVIIRFDDPEDLVPLRPALIQYFGNTATLRPNMVILPWGLGGSISQQTLLQVLKTMIEAKESWKV